MNNKDLMQLVCVAGVIFNTLAGVVALISGESTQLYVITLLLWIIVGNQYENS